MYVYNSAVKILCSSLHSFPLPSFLPSFVSFHKYLRANCMFGTILGPWDFSINNAKISEHLG